MMTYEEFKEKVTSSFVSYMPEKYRHMAVLTTTCYKINRKLDSLSLKNPDEHENISPTLYINYLYEHYLETEDFDLVLSLAAETMDEAFSELPPDKHADIDLPTDRIVFQLINTLQNEAYLKDLPHRDFHDLSIIYRCVVRMAGSVPASYTTERQNLP